MANSFMDWVRDCADARGMDFDEVRELTSISPLRWNRLVSGYPPTKEEAEDVATEAFGLFPAEAYTSDERHLATKFRNFLENKRPREVYRFPRLWPKVQEQINFRNEFLEDPEETFNDVLQDDMSDDSW